MSDTVINSADTALRRGDLAEAEKLYGQAVAIDPVAAYYGLGSVAISKGQGPEAVSWLEKAANIEPDAPDVLFNLAHAYIKVGQKDEAIKRLDHATNFCLGDFGLLGPICNLLMRLDRADAVYQALSKSTITGPKRDSLLVHTLGRLGYWRAAINLLNRMTDQDPSNPEIWREKSRAAAYLRDYDTAIDSFQKYMDMVDAGDKDRLALADLYMLARRGDAAKATINAVLDNGYRVPDVYLIAAKCARLDGDFSDALSLLAKAVEERPAFGSARAIIVELCPKEQLTVELLACRKALTDPSLKPYDRAAIYYAIGGGEERLKNIEAAFAAFEKANEVQGDEFKLAGKAYDPEKEEAYIARVETTLPPALEGKAAPMHQTPIFIVGMPRSGTTLVERMLSSHQQVEAGGENEALEFVVTDYIHAVRAGKSREPDQLGEMGWSELASDYWQRTNFSASYVTDKMPHNFRNIGFILRMFPDAPIIHMRRDPRDVCLSIYSKHFPDGHTYAVDMKSLAHFYALSEKTMQHFSATYPGRIHQVRYPDLVRAPEKTSQNIYNFCNLEWSADCLDFHKQQGPAFTFSELQVRQPLNTKGIGKWRNYEAVLAPLVDALEKAGIDLSTWDEFYA